MKASDLLVQALEAEGVRWIFGVPGEENLDLLESLRESSIQLVVTRHEQAAGFMAATVGRLTGHAGVCLSTLGPGATNLATAAAYAQLGGMPMVMLTGQKPIKHSKQGLFQIIDVVETMGPLTKYATQIVGADTIPARLREAFRLAEDERPGAAHLELPEDVAREESAAPLLPVARARRPVAEAKAVARALELLRAAKRPLLVLGSGANRKLTNRMLTRFVEQTGIYFVTTQMGKGVVDERHERYLGNAALSDKDYVHCALDRADLIVNVGHDVVEKPPFFMEHGGRQVIHVNFSRAQVDSVYFPQHEVVGDIAHTIWQLCEALDEEPPTWEPEPFARIKADLDAQLREGAADERFPILPPTLVAQLRDALPSDAILALDNGMYKLWFARNYRAHQPNTVLLDNALATMGAGLPSAMAAKLVHPERPVLAVCGDGGFMMNSQELETATRLGLDLVVLILNDSGYGMIKWKQASMGLPDYGLDYTNPDFVRYAESYGAQGHRVEATDQLVPTLERALDAGGVHLIDVPVDYSDNLRALKTALEERACSI